MIQIDTHEHRYCRVALTCGWLAATTAVWSGCDDGSKDVEKGTDPMNPTDAGDTGDSDGPTDTDSEGIVSRACLNEIDETFADADAQALFDYDHVPTFDIFLPDDEWESLQKNAIEEQYTEAEVCFDGRGIGTVGLRFKGSYGTLYACFNEQGELTCPRLSMKLKFNKYVEDQRFFGLKRLNFNANRYDDSRMKERMAYDIYRAMDIVTPRAAWAVVRVNGKSFGLYGMVEQVDGRFTDNRWPEYPDGNLYKEAWPTDTDFTHLVTTLRTNEEEADPSGFQAFSEAIAAADEADVLSTLAEYTDLDYWARYMAVDEAVLSYDGITYFWTDGVTFHNHNYYFYEHTPGRFTIVPWDVESTFWINPDHAPPHWTEIPDDCSLTYPYWGGLAVAPGCDPVLSALATDMDAWREAAQELLDGPFAEDKMLETIDRYAEFIGEEARKPETPTMYSTFDSAVGEMRNVIPRLRERLEGLVADKE